MPRKSFTPEQIIAKPRQIEGLIGQGQSVAGGGRYLGAELLPLAQRVWGHGCDPSQAIEGAEEGESTAERLVADLALDKAMLEEVARGNF